MTIAAYGAVRALLGDVSDVVASVAVAGLSFPDPDLPTEVRDLAGRARAIGIDAGAERLDGLADALDALAATPDRAERLERSARAIDALHRVLAWLRTFRAELDLIVVEAGLRRGDQPDDAPVVTRRVSPVGFELRGERLTIAALDDVDGEPVVLLDVLAEVDRLDPLGRPVISRLFQDRISLRDVLSSGVELIAHPVGAHGGRRVFAPAFATRPRLRASARAPRVGPLVTTPAGGLDPAQPGPGRIALTVLSRHGRIGVRTPAGVPVGLAPTPVLRTVLTKLLIREGVDEVTLDATLQHKGDTWQLLAAEDTVEGRCYPAWDPAAFGIAPAALARRAPTGVDGLWLRTAAALFGGIDDAEREALAVAVVAADARDAIAALRLGMAARMLGVARPVDPDLLLRAATSSDEREVLAALWLAESAGALDTLPLAVLLERRVGPVEEGDIAAVAVRAMLRARVDPDGLSEAAVAFVEAHVHTLQRAIRQPDAPLPDLLELVLLGDVLAWLRGADRLGQVVVPLGFQRDRLWRAAVDVLHAWTENGPARDAGDALLLVASAGLDAWILPR